ncbi:hypothetical protein R6Q59_018789 [Mikania micrantha]
MEADLCDRLSSIVIQEANGFCCGVEYVVQIAYEAKIQFPDEKIWITNEIIHNPTVNKCLGLCVGFAFIILDVL